MKPLFTFLISIWLSLHAGPANSNTILVLGDSLSAAYGIDTNAGWVQMLEHKINSSNLPYKVVNASISGDTTTGGSQRLPLLLENYKPVIVILELGANDGLRGFPLDLIHHNLKSMIELCHDSNASVVLAGIKIPPNYGRKYTDRFYSIYNELSKMPSVEYVPFLLEGVGGVSGMMQDDGLHPNEKGQIVILDNVWSELKQLLLKRVN